MHAKIIVIGTLILLLDIVSAPAHSGKSHLTGTVVSTDTKTLFVKNDSGKIVTVRLTGDTTCRRHGDASPATAADLNVGDRVVIDLFGMPGREQTALEVRFSSSPAAPGREPAGPHESSTQHRE